MPVRCKKRTMPSAFQCFRQVPMIIQLITKALLLRIFVHASSQNHQTMHKFSIWCAFFALTAVMLHQISTSCTLLAHFVLGDHHQAVLFQAAQHHRGFYMRYALMACHQLAYQRTQ